jgi:hypothetical protein
VSLEISDAKLKNCVERLALTGPEVNNATQNWDWHLEGLIVSPEPPKIDAKLILHGRRQIVAMAKSKLRCDEIRPAGGVFDEIADCCAGGLVDVPFATEQIHFEAVR